MSLTLLESKRNGWAAARGATTGLVQDRGPLPDGFVGDGIAVIDERDNQLDVLLVDDLCARALRLWIDSWR